MTSLLAPLLTAIAAGDDLAAEQAVVSLGAYSEAALPELTALFQTEDPNTRWWAVRALVGIERPESIPLLRTALTDPELPVRQCAARGLADLPRTELLSELVACLTAGDALLARLAGNALIALGKTAVPALLESLENGPQAARVDAVRALAEIKDPRAVPAFFKAVQDGDSPLVEHWADVGLQNLGIGMSFFKP